MYTLLALLLAATCHGFPNGNWELSNYPEVNEKGHKIYEGDMVLTAEQADALYSNTSERKGANSLWKDGYVPYYIDKTSEPDRMEITRAIIHWMTNTCLQFYSVKEDYPEPHLKFHNNGGGCSSYVGAVAQEVPVSIGKGCATLGTIVHEIGHAIGFHHEQARTDRDKYVKVLYHNMMESMGFNFRIAPGSNFYGIPYDYESIMHYDLNGFSKNGKNTLVPLDKTKNFRIGQSHSLSFYDIKLANLMYNCSAMCHESPKCMNEGFLNVHCNCQCPEGFTGELCETPVKVEEDLVCGQTYTAETTISTDFMQSIRNNCSWFIQGPEGSLVVAKFHHFHLFDSGPLNCQHNYLEVRIRNPTEGNMFCGKSLENYEITTVTNTMDLFYFTSFIGYPYGFKADIKFLRK